MLWVGYVGKANNVIEEERQWELKQAVRAGKYCRGMRWCGLQNLWFHFSSCSLLMPSLKCTRGNSSCTENIARVNRKKKKNFLCCGFPRALFMVFEINTIMSISHPASGACRLPTVGTFSAAHFVIFLGKLKQKIFHKTFYRKMTSKKFMFGNFLAGADKQPKKGIFHACYH